MKKRIATLWVANVGLVLAALFACGGITPSSAIWCARYSNGSNNCGFHTQDQCRAAVSGVGGYCNQEGGEEPRRVEHKEKRKAEPKARKEPTRPATTEPPATAQPAPSSRVVQPAPAPASAPTFQSARALIAAGRYEDGIAAMKALGYDNQPDVASAIGYANAQLRRLPEARKWYDRALATDPNHLATLNYSGALHVAQDELVPARADLARIKTVCGNSTCPEYRQLERLIAAKLR